jgi:hypothetical protein
MNESTISVNLSNEHLHTKRIHLPKRSTTIALDVVAVLFIILFVYAAISKMNSVSTFELQLSKSPMLVSYAYILSWTLPPFELIVAALLIFPRTRLIGFYISYGLMFMFTAYIIAITQFSDDIPCSCGGILQNMTWNQHLVFNIFFSLIGLTGVLFYSKPKKITKV